MKNDSPGEVTQLLAAVPTVTGPPSTGSMAFFIPSCGNWRISVCDRSTTPRPWTPPPWCTSPYLRLVKAGRIAVENRNHFLAYAAHVMRSVVVDFIRHARAQRRGGEHLHVTLNSNVLDSVESSESEIVRLNDLLLELAQLDQRLVSVVEMPLLRSARHRADRGMPGRDQPHGVTRSREGQVTLDRWTGHETHRR